MSRMTELYQMGVGNLAAHVGTNGLTVGAANYFGPRQSASSKLIRFAAGDVVTITPNRFQNDLESVRSYVDTLARDMAAEATNPRLTATWKAGWTDFLVRWGTFYADMQGRLNAWLASAFPNLTGSWQTIIRFSEEAQQWARSFRELGGRRTIVPESMPRQPDPPNLNPFQAQASPFVWGLLAVGGLLAVVALKRS